MKIHLIKEQTIWDYVRTHASSRPGFARWLEILKSADWEQPEDMSFTFPSVDKLGRGTDRVVFDVGGNNHRMICKYLFSKKRVHIYICWIGTHAEYTRLCDNDEQYSVNKF